MVTAAIVPRKQHSLFLVRAMARISDEPLKVWVGSVAKATTEDELLYAFRRAGIDGAYRAVVRNTERPFAFVEFHTAEQAAAAIDTRGVECNGCFLMIKSAGRTKASPWAGTTSAAVQAPLAAQPQLAAVEELRWG